MWLQLLAGLCIFGAVADCKMRSYRVRDALWRRPARRTASAKVHSAPLGCVLGNVLGTSSGLGTALDCPTAAATCYHPATHSEMHNSQTAVVNSFKYRCDHGHLNVVACIGSMRTNYAEIPLNDKITIGGFDFSCKRDGHTITYSEGTGPYIAHAGCIVTIGGHRSELSNGQSAMDGAVQYQCVISHNSAHIVPKYVGCNMNGMVRQPGETWIGSAGSFQVKWACQLQQGGRHYSVKPIACVSSDGREMAVGSTHVWDNYAHRCSSTWNGGLSYTRTPMCSYTHSCYHHPIMHFT